MPKLHLRQPEFNLLIVVVDGLLNIVEEFKNSEK